MYVSLVFHKCVKRDQALNDEKIRKELLFLGWGWGESVAFSKEETLGSNTNFSCAQH